MFDANMVRMHAAEECSLQPATILALSIALYLAVAAQCLSSRLQGYSSVRHTLSELGVAGTDYERWVAWGLFLPVGLVCAGLALWQHLHGHGPAKAGLALAIAVGYWAAALFPCDPGISWGGSWRNRLHGLGGAVEYGGGAIALTALAVAGDRVDSFFALSALSVALVALTLPFKLVVPVRGVTQRVAEAVLFVALIQTTMR